MTCKLSILIPTITSRVESLRNLIDKLDIQRNEDVQILIEADAGEISIGEKRNVLLSKAAGDYVCFFDDDDLPGSNYIKNILDGIERNVDCISLRGVITWDGDRPEIFEHSIRYDAYKTNDTGFPKYERYPNHLNAIRAGIAKQFKFPEINHGEDTDWATQIKNSGLIKTEHYVDEVTYHYQYKTK